MSAGSRPPDKRRGAPAGQPKPLNVAAATTPLDSVHVATAVRQERAAALTDRLVLELPGDLFVRSLVATDQEWHQAAELAGSRLPRCRPGGRLASYYDAVCRAFRARQGRA